MNITTSYIHAPFAFNLVDTQIYYNSSLIFLLPFTITHTWATSIHSYWVHPGHITLQTGHDQNQYTQPWTTETKREVETPSLIDVGSNLIFQQSICLMLMYKPPGQNTYPYTTFHPPKKYGTSSSPKSAKHFAFLETYFDPCSHIKPRYLPCSTLTILALKLQTL